jgi:glucuronate isomerase
MPFLDDDFLLAGAAARDLYHRVAAAEPIIDYHCHLSPRDIAEDRRFENLHEAWLAGDHYKWRAMRADGVPEDLITGAAPPQEKFRAWARTVPHTLRNPLFHWTHLELRRYFGIETLLEASTADAVWAEANRQLATADLSARGILARFKVELVGTTDDPADPLDWHEKIAASACPTRVVPTLRPDAALKVMQPERVQAWARRLGDAAGIAADTFPGLLAALEKRHADFARAGCRATDHGLEYLPDVTCTDAEAAAIWERARRPQGSRPSGSPSGSCSTWGGSTMRPAG